jgi:hypothetical protein
MAAPIPLIDRPRRDLELVSLRDPAVDQVRLDEKTVEVYRRTWDRTRLPYRPGETPIVFYVTTLGAPDVATIEGNLMGALQRLPGGVILTASPTAVLDAIFAASVHRVRAAVWDPEGGHRTAEVPPDRWPVIPAELRHDIATIVRGLSKPFDVPAREDPGKS